MEKREELCKRGLVTEYLTITPKRKRGTIEEQCTDESSPQREIRNSESHNESVESNMEAKLNEIHSDFF